MDAVLLSFFNRQTRIAALAELVGTFFLTLSALLVPAPFKPLAVGLTLLVLVYGIGNTSCCHINPAVTVGLMWVRRFPFGAGIFYILAQFAGAILARLLAGLVGDIPPGGGAAGIFGEFFGFGILMLTVTAVTENEVPKTGSGIAIGGALMAGLLFSNGILNPAVALAALDPLSAAMWVTPLSGIAFASLFRLFRGVTPPQ